MNDRLVLALPSGARPGVVWYAPLLNFSGYADEARAFTLGLRQRGVDLRAEAIGDPSAAFLAGLDPAMRAALDDARRSPRPRHAVHVLHMPGQTLTRLPGASYHVARSMFETDGLPAAWVPRLNDMDEVWVPTAFNVDTFRAAGVDVPIHVVPGGVHPSLFVGAAPLPIGGLRSTVFLSVFEWSFRKGWDVLLQAWAKAFGPNDDVTLLLRTYPMKRPGAQETAADIERQIDRFLGNLGTSRKRVAPIVVLHEPIADADMPRLYATASAYVAPTRGEGWGRPMLEAMASGLPVIATRWSGNLAFMHDDNSLLLDIDGLDKIDHREELEFYRGQSWAKPSARHLTQLLTAVVADPAAVRAVGQRAQTDVAAQWTWDAAVGAAAERIDAITAGLRRSSPSPATSVPVRWVGEQYSWHSLAQVNRELCARLVASDALDVELLTREADSTRAVRGDAVAALEARTGDVLARPPRVEVRHQWPPDWRAPRQGAWVVMQPWEFGGLPDEWIPHLVHEVDEIWCYTDFVRDSYLASGVPLEKLRVIPLGVDTTVFRPSGPPLALRTTKQTRFLFVGGTIERKGIDVLLDAYTSSFGPGDDVCLVIKSTGASTVYEHNSMEARIAALAADPSIAAIELITDDLSREDMAALYRSCDALVHPYRGEGFGLPIAEAMACGLPVVVTDHGAARDFCDDDSAYLIPSRVVPVPEGGLTPNTAGYWWAEPDVDALRAILRDVVADPCTARVKADAALRWVESELSWDRAARTIEQRLVELATVVPTRFSEPVTETGPERAHSRSQFVLQGSADGLVAACMIVKDEADNLPTCLAALDGLVDEIVVYDTGSTDATVAIARAAGATVIEGIWNDDFAAARNRALHACTGEWILWVDADEILQGDRAAFRDVLAKHPPVDTIQVVIDNLDGAGAAIGHSHRAARVFRRERAHWSGRLHERVVARAGERALRDGFTTHIRFLHTGYQDDAVAAKGKSERNIRLAELELRDGSDHRSLVLINLGRSLASAGRLGDALGRFDEALAQTDDPSERRLALRHGAEALLDAGRADDALVWIARLRAASDRADMADYLEGIAQAALGDTAAALDCLTPLLRVLDDDGFALPDHVLRLRRAHVLRGAQRWGEAADELLAIASDELAPPWGVLAELNWRAGRDPDVVAGAIPHRQLTAAVGQLLGAPPEAADGVVDALLRRWPDDAAVLACAATIAPQLSLERSLEWSARLRAAGLVERCPLLAMATNDQRPMADRVQAACVAFGAFGDERANLAAVALAPAVPVDEMLDTLVLMGELAPGLLPSFVVAAASDADRTIAVARCLDELGASDAAEELLALGAQ